MKPVQADVFSVLLSPVTAATTARTANLDCQGADYATIVISIGAEANTNSTNVAVNLSESDDTVATNFATFNTSFSQTVDNTAGTIEVFHVNLTGRKRYLRLAVTPDTTTNGAVITAASAILKKELQGLNASNAPNIVVG